VPSLHPEKTRQRRRAYRGDQIGRCLTPTAPARKTRSTERTRRPSLLATTGGVPDRNLATRRSRCAPFANRFSSSTSSASCAIPSHALRSRQTHALHGFVRAVLVGDYQVVELLKSLTPCIDQSNGAMQHDTGGRMRSIHIAARSDDPIRVPG
jgi:hypothetical protein